MTMVVSPGQAPTVVKVKVFSPKAALFELK